MRSWRRPRAPSQSRAIRIRDGRISVLRAILCRGDTVDGVAWLRRVLPSGEKSPRGPPIAVDFSGSHNPADRRRLSWWASRSRGSFGATLIWLDLSRALVVFQRDSHRVRGGLDAICLPGRTHAPLSRLSFSLGSFAVRLSLTPPSRELDEHAAARSLRRWINLIYACLLTHVVIRQGLPHSTSERPAHPKPGSRVGRGFPLTVQMPQPVRPTSWVHSLDNTLKITTLPDGPSLHHRHLPRGSRPHRADNLPHHRPLSLLLEIMPLPL